MSKSLENIASPADLKKFSIAQLENLAKELRAKIIATTAQNGGHLASSLGVVELTLALHYVFNSPTDKIVWDVGHQAYAHKLLTGRFANFDTLRQLDGISGFPKRNENPHDCFDVGHSSTSISAALGMAIGRDSKQLDNKVIAVIGDGSLTAGMAYEALNNAGGLDRDLIIILNDNDMSISPNVGALSSFLSRKMTSRFFVRFKKETEIFLNSVPRFGKDLVQLARRTEDSFKAFVTPGMLFEAFGIEYVGPIDGHNLNELVETLNNVSKLQGPTLIHTITKKGKGYKPAEENPSLFHGVGPFNQETGTVIPAKTNTISYTTMFGKYLCQLAEQNKQIVAITAAMSSGTGLIDFAKKFPTRFFDVGIAEQHAVTMAAGMACEGLRPVVTIYSTFLQRAYDNVLHDVCLQNLPVTFAIDRGGLVGADGPTHHGVFDLSYLRHMPNISVMVPRDGDELKRAMLTATTVNGPFAYRYPRGNIQIRSDKRETEPIEIGTGEQLRSGDDATIIALGPCVQTALLAANILSKDNINIGVIDARFLKPLDTNIIINAAQTNSNIITIEENVLAGGFGSAVMELLEQKQIYPKVLRIGLPDKFIEQGSQEELRNRYGLDADSIAAQIKEFVSAIA
ncbi:MAG: 1-deoxy-D-xylulose-5-phosphate synthase [Desulfobacteraceae bacterium 4572_35.1]|nr:MAG: 1-deoxy-D-xylulose-5-phosphate synthase [Desulfobacteraceae bacterium 4572_35.1]